MWSTNPMLLLLAFKHAFQYWLSLQLCWKRNSWIGAFLWILQKVFRTASLQKTSERLLSIHDFILIVRLMFQSRIYKVWLLRARMELSKPKCRCSQPEEFCKRVVLRIFAKFIAKHVYQSCEFIRKVVFENFTQ